MSAIPWTKCQHEIPPENIEVETKIDDAKGIRNVQSLLRYRGLWWHPDKSMYVYYSPTHWRHINQSEYLRRLAKEIR
jgi:hypothetical protein